MFVQAWSVAIVAATASPSASPSASVSAVDSRCWSWWSRWSWWSSSAGAAPMSAYTLRIAYNLSPVSQPIRQSRVRVAEWEGGRGGVSLLHSLSRSLGRAVLLVPRFFHVVVVVASQNDTFNAYLTCRYIRLRMQSPPFRRTPFLCRPCLRLRLQRKDASGSESELTPLIVTLRVTHTHEHTCVCVSWHGEYECECQCDCEYS